MMLECKIASFQELVCVRHCTRHMHPLFCMVLTLNPEKVVWFLPVKKLRL